MKKEVNPKDTPRNYAFENWMKAPMPMVTFFKTLDVSRLIEVSKERNMKFNMLMCWCIGKAASQVKEFYMLPVDGKLIQYDSLAVNTIVLNKENEVSSCDVPFNDNIEAFNRDYLALTEQVKQSCDNHDETERMVIGTSALVQYDIDNPFLIWAKYQKEPSKENSKMKATLKVSFQFHHTQMDGAHAATFLGLIQQEINNLT